MVTFSTLFSYFEMLCWCCESIILVWWPTVINLVKKFSYLLKIGSIVLTKGWRPALPGLSGSIHPSQPPEKMIIKNILKILLLNGYKHPLQPLVGNSKLTNTIMKGKANSSRKFVLFDHLKWKTVFDDIIY